MNASYLDSDQFILANGDYTAVMAAGRRVKADCGADGVRYLTVSSSSYSAPHTTVTTRESEITSNLVGIEWSLVGAGVNGGLPAHTHADDDQGGALSAYVAKALFGVNAILKADTSGEPESMTVPASTLVGRGETGDIAALDAAAVRELLNLATIYAALAGATFTGDVKLGDSVKHIFGTDTDFFVLNDGTTQIFRSVLSDVSFQYYPGSTQHFIRFLKATGNLELYGSGTKICTITSTGIAIAGGCRPATDGNVDLGTSSLRWNDIYAENATIQTSDERLKKNITDTEMGLDFIMALRPVSFVWRDTIIPAQTIPGEPPLYDAAGKLIQDAVPERIVPEQVISHSRPHQGYVAQEVKAAMDAQGIGDFAGWIEGDDGTQGVRTGEFLPIHTKAIQELKGILDAAIERIAALEAKVASLEAE